MNNNGKLSINAALKILKPPSEVYEAIIDPSKMCNYFISESTGRLEEGKELTWKFAEMDMRFPVRTGKLEKDKFISWSWDDFEGGETHVTITLEPKNNGETFVKITEGEKPADEKGLTWFGRNTEGWANFLACLKGWMEYGINLRKGAFDLSQMPEQQ